MSGFDSELDLAVRLARARSDRERWRGRALVSLLLNALLLVALWFVMFFGGRA